MEEHGYANSPRVMSEGQLPPLPPEQEMKFSLSAAVKYRLWQSPAFRRWFTPRLYWITILYVLFWPVVEKKPLVSVFLRCVIRHFTFYVNSKIIWNWWSNSTFLLNFRIASNVCECLPPYNINVLWNHSFNFLNYETKGNS